MSSDNIAIRVQGVSKCYQIYDHPQDRLKQSIVPRLQRLAGYVPTSYFREFWALRNVSFEMNKGEAVGIVGRNGSGKSTLLQIICGILTPTSGIVYTNGRLAALLELGAGFNPDFSGRENIYMNGAILGLNKSEIDERFDNIAAFADIGDFIEQPVKMYSSGMFLRLAFAVQANLDPDILVVDEALSVGDQFFQAKCYSTIHGLMDKGCTILIVSHSAATIKALCHRAILLEDSNQIMDGPSDKVLDKYFVLGSKKNIFYSTEPSHQESQQSGKTISDNRLSSQLQPSFSRRISERVGSGKARFTECLIMCNGDEVNTITTGTQCTIRAILEVYEDCIYEGEVGIVVATIEGVELFAINSFFQDQSFPPLISGRCYAIDFEFMTPLSGWAKYRVDLGYRMPVQGEYVDKVFSAAIFEVINSSGHVVPLLFDVPGRINVQTI